VSEGLTAVAWCSVTRRSTAVYGFLWVDADGRIEHDVMSLGVYKLPATTPPAEPNQPPRGECSLEVVASKGQTIVLHEAGLVQCAVDGEFETWPCPELMLASVAPGASPQIIQRLADQTGDFLGPITSTSMGYVLEPRESLFAGTASLREECDSHCALPDQGGATLELWRMLPTELYSDGETVLVEGARSGQAFGAWKRGKSLVGPVGVDRTFSCEYVESRYER